MDWKKLEITLWSILIPWLFMLSLVGILDTIGVDLSLRELVDEFSVNSSIWEKLELILWGIGFYLGWYILGLSIYKSMSQKKGDK